MSAESALFPNLVISEKGTIRDAMAAITANGREVVLVRDDANRIVGLITDGDIRRGLLSGLLLDSQASAVMSRNFYFVDSTTERAAVLDVMKARSFRHVPIINHDRLLVGIHFLRDLIGATLKPNIAVVMAGGKGTRLRPVTQNIPKPMVEVAGRPMLERIVLHLVGHGIRKIFLSVNYMADKIEEHFGDGDAFGCRIEYLRETTSLGTGGALSLLPIRPDQPFLVLNGDLITNIDVTAMLETHVRRGHVGTMGVGPYQVRIPFGTVTELSGQLVTLEEKPSINVLINRGIYVLDPAVLDHVPSDREFPITALFDMLLAQRKSVGVYYFDDSWIDVGAPEDLRRARGLSEG
jgi:dTDP-glucose pyrophosphorylase